MARNIDLDDAMAQFIEALRQNDIIVNKPIIADGRFHRLACVGDSWGKN